MDVFPVHPNINGTCYVDENSHEGVWQVCAIYYVWLADLTRMLTNETTC